MSMSENDALIVHQSLLFSLLLYYLSLTIHSICGLFVQKKHRTSTLSINSRTPIPPNLSLIKSSPSLPLPPCSPSSPSSSTFQYYRERCHVVLFTLFYFSFTLYLLLCFSTLLHSSIHSFSPTPSFSALSLRFLFYTLPLISLLMEARKMEFKSAFRSSSNDIRWILLSLLLFIGISFIYRIQSGDYIMDIQKNISNMHPMAAIAIYAGTIGLVVLFYPICRLLSLVVSSSASSVSSASSSSLTSLSIPPTQSIEIKSPPHRLPSVIPSSSPLPHTPTAVSAYTVMPKVTEYEIAIYTDNPNGEIETKKPEMSSGSGYDSDRDNDHMTSSIIVINNNNNTTTNNNNTNNNSQHDIRQRLPIESSITSVGLFTALYPQPQPNNMGIGEYRWF